ncbi:helix-turn-helix domain-containing protein [Sinorhizobium meliloti]|uniref:helix-turn-helix domain-containing protein n=1 Tax=Rhizobium meliloti TaxID=382 RepID=UPI001F293671|nr:helix-turn-helix domain-containing protein [Sinorhizobium meliloti]
MRRWHTQIEQFNGSALVDATFPGGGDAFSLPLAPQVPKIDRAEILLRLQQGQGPSKIARDLGISRGTVYQARKGVSE